MGVPPLLPSVTIHLDRHVIDKRVVGSNPPTTAAACLTTSSHMLTYAMFLPQAKPVPDTAIARGSRDDADCGPVGWVMDENGALLARGF